MAKNDKNEKLKKVDEKINSRVDAFMSEDNNQLDSQDNSKDFDEAAIVKEAADAIDEESLPEGSDEPEVPEQPVLEKNENIAQSKPKPKKRKFFNKKIKIVLVALLILLVGALAYPTSRYSILNTAGVRSSTSIVILDESTRQPLKDVTVSVGETNTLTNDEGRATLTDLKLGKAQLVVQRRAFAEQSRDITLGWGSNPQDDMLLKPTGLQFAINVVDYFSDKPIEKAEATSFEASSFSDKEGNLLLTVDPKDDQSVPVSVGAEGYRQEELQFSEQAKETKTVKLVPSRKQVFVSKKSGRYDVYRIDADGKNQEKILSGTGTERDDMVLSVHPNKDYAALVSTRENQRDSNGELKNTLTFIDSETKSSRPITTDSNIQIVGWHDDYLVYVKSLESKGDNFDTSQRLLVYNVASGDLREVVTNTYLNDVQLVNGEIFYAPSTPISGSSQRAGLFVADIDSGSPTRLMKSEIWTILRTSYGELSLSSTGESGERWFSYKLGDSQTTRATGAPANQNDRNYVPSADASKNLWMERRDGKGTILIYDTKSGKERVLVAQSGLTYPLRWLNNTTIVFRVVTESESADYAVSTNGGSVKKIVDVTNTSGINTWYRY